jgi:hypothetical protein
VIAPAKPDEAKAEISRPVITRPSQPHASTPMADIPLTNSPSHAQHAPSHPVHTMQSEIINSGLVDAISASSENMVCSPVQRGYSEIDADDLDPALVESVGAAIRGMKSSEPPRSRPQMPPLQPSVQPEPKKSGGFSVFGITIGGSTSAKRPGPSAKSSTSPSAARMSGVGSAAANSQAINLMREAGLSKERSEELLKSMSDDQLDIPAFLRRQVN